MQDEFETILPEYFLQECIRLINLYDYEFSSEIFILAPTEINDLYNQN